MNALPRLLALALLGSLFAAAWAVDRGSLTLPLPGEAWSEQRRVALLLTLVIAAVVGACALAYKRFPMFLLWLGPVALTVFGGFCVFSMGAGTEGFNLSSTLLLWVASFGGFLLVWIAVPSLILRYWKRDPLYLPGEQQLWFPGLEAPNTVPRVLRPERPGATAALAQRLPEWDNARNALNGEEGTARGQAARALQRFAFWPRLGSFARVPKVTSQTVASGGGRGTFSKLLSREVPIGAVLALSGAAAIGITSSSSDVLPPTAQRGSSFSEQLIRPKPISVSPGSADAAAPTTINGASGARAVEASAARVRGAERPDLLVVYSSSSYSPETSAILEQSLVEHLRSSLSGAETVSVLEHESFGQRVNYAFGVKFAGDFDPNSLSAQGDTETTLKSPKDKLYTDEIVHAVIVRRLRTSNTKPEGSNKLNQTYPIGVAPGASNGKATLHVLGGSKAFASRDEARTFVDSAVSTSPDPGDDGWLVIPSSGEHHAYQRPEPVRQEDDPENGEVNNIFGLPTIVATPETPDKFTVVLHYVVRDIEVETHFVKHFEHVKGNHAYNPAVVVGEYDWEVELERR